MTQRIEAKKQSQGLKPKTGVFAAIWVDKDSKNVGEASARHQRRELMK
jgi:hypothetical protein